MLEIQGIAKTFNADTPNEVRSLRGVNLELAAGSWVIIIGTNGSGKSTLLNAVAGTFLVDEGTIRLGGTRRDRDGPSMRAPQLIGRVFQNPFSGTSPSLTIEENLSLAALRGRGRGLGWGLKQSLVARMRDEVSRLNMGLENRLENAIGSLSGGQRQALTLLMATWLRPELLLLDEHTAALDPKSADLVIALTEQVVARDQAHHADGDALHAPGGKSGRPANHDAPRPDHPRFSRRRKTAAASRRFAGPLRRSAARRTAGRKRSRDARRPVHLSVINRIRPGPMYGMHRAA